MNGIGTQEVVITDHTFENLAIEEEVLRNVGCALIAHRCRAESELGPLVEEADCVITQFAPITSKVISSMKRARAIVRYGIGVDNVDLEAAGRAGIPVCNVPDYCTDEVADHTLSMILMLTRRTAQIANRIRRRASWNGADVETMRALKHLTIGVIGYGRIGREVVSRLKPFKGRILVYDPAIPSKEMANEGVERTELPDLLKASDVVTLHCPSTAATRGLIDAKSLATMKPGVILINVARGSIVSEADLIKALQNGQVGGAGLDVTDPEPIESSNPMLSMENVFITSHVASCSTHAVKRLRTRVAEIAGMAVQGKALPNIVNREWLSVSSSETFSSEAEASIQTSPPARSSSE